MSHFQNGNDYCNEIVELFQKRRRPSDTTDRARNKQCRDEIADRKDKKLKKSKCESSKKGRHLSPHHVE